MNRRFFIGGVVGILGFSALMISVMLYNQYLNPDQGHGTLELFSDSIFVIMFVIWNLLMFYVGGECVRKYDLRKNAYKALYLRKYSTDEPELAIKQFRREFWGRCKRKASLAIGGAPIVYFIFEGKFPSQPIDWVISLGCVLIGLWMYFSSNLVTYEKWD